MMMQTFIGQKYSYKIEQHKIGEVYSFELKAVDKNTRRASYINTVNPLLSELEINPNDSRLWESEWILTKVELKTFSEKIKGLLSDKKYLSYFESYLDKDRMEGEWENIEGE